MDLFAPLPSAETEFRIFHWIRCDHYPRYGRFPRPSSYVIRDIEKDLCPAHVWFNCNSILKRHGSHQKFPRRTWIFSPGPIIFFSSVWSWTISRILPKWNNGLRKTPEARLLSKLTLDNQTLFCKKKKEIPVYTKEQLNIIFRFAEKTGLPVVGHHQFEIRL